ncbi:ABC transporter permease [Demequina aurantiaca]|uniref:ABC transporter permease n=1 Tax=Demequina aurantiaca TaxID=676200 RepID=UPI003D33A273
MTATTERPAAAAKAAPKAPHGNPWMPTFRGVGLVARIELTRRRPTTKGYIFYGLLVLAILGLGILVAAVSAPGLTSMPMELVLILVLGAGLLIAPSLSSTSINGDSSEGVLAPMQMTRLTAGDLALGKLLASWLFAVAVLITTTPLLVYAFSRSGWHWYELAAVLGAILFTVLTFTAIGLAWSSLAARAVASVSLAHLTTGFLVLGTLVIFAFAMPLVSETVTVTDRFVDYENLSADQQEAYQNGTADFSTLPCIEQSYESSVAHTENIAWLLLANPMIVIGEASPVVNPNTYQEDGRAAPGVFAFMHQQVGNAQLGPQDTPQGYDECAQQADTGQSDQWEQQQEDQALFPRNPWVGLALQAALLIGSVMITIRRLRVPYKKLRAGTRVA